MAFGQTYEQKKAGGSSGEVRESPYLRLKAGDRFIRILDDDAVMCWQYFLDVNVDGRQQGRGVIVGGIDNPVKRYMDSLGEDHPKYRRASRQFLLNVLDRTPVQRGEGTVIYPDEFGAFGGKGPVEPNNRVMILGFGPQLMEQFTNLHNRMRNPKTGAAMAIQDFDLQIFTRGTGRDTKKSAIPSPDHEAQLPLQDAIRNGPRYDLKLATRPMPDEAQDRLLSGEDYTAVLRSLGWESIKPLW